MVTVAHTDIFKSACASSLTRFADALFSTGKRKVLTYEDVHEDIDRLIHTVATRSQDTTCASLSYEELKGESFLKVAEVLKAGWLERSKTRSEFFAIMATAIKNNVCSLIQRYRFTQKRTGIKPPPKEDRKEIMRLGPDHASFNREHSKPVEVSLNDEDTHLQVSEASNEEDRDYRELKEELLSILTAVERVVFCQMAEPNMDALLHAQLEACIGLSDHPTKVKIKDTHLAAGIGMPMPEFKRYQETIRLKLKKHMSNTEDDTAFVTALATLKQLFGLQIPASVDPQIRSRLLSIAARQQYQKVEGNPAIKKALVTVGALVPEATGDKLRCFGIMFQKNHRICNSCGLKLACEAKAGNFGLGELTLSPKLLGARSARVPVITPNSPESDNAGNTRDEEIVCFLNENFKRVIHQGDVYYRHEDCTGPGMQFIFGTGKQGSSFRLRFVNPSETLHSSLQLETLDLGAGRPAWYVSDATTAAEAISLIRAHAEATFSATAQA